MSASAFAALPQAALQAIALQAWRSWICRACGLVYDEAVGDPDSGLAPGTRFEDIPDDWACPLCGVTKADFEPHDPVAPTRRAPAEPVPVAGRRADPGIVIVGAGRAGWQAAQALRELDADVPITLVSACSGDAYDKPLLSVACARELAPAQWVREDAAAIAARLNVRLLARTDAVAIDSAARRLRTTRGSLRYRRLVLAHGAAPRVSPVLAPDLCWRINDLVAYRRLRTALGTQRRHVVIVGAGLVGSELANDLALAGHGVTLLDVADRPLAAQLPALASQRLLEAWRGLPLRFVGGVQIAALERIEDMVCVTTTCGRTYEADQVIAATGLAPTTRLADRAGLVRDDGGIAVRAADLRTSDPHIHALGDCASVEGRALRYIEPIARQAQAIASAILGDGGVHYVPTVVPLRVKTSAMPFTVHGVPAAGVGWQVDADADGRLEMTQRVGEDIVARLEAMARPSARLEPRLAAA